MPKWLKYVKYTFMVLAALLVVLAATGLIYTAYEKNQTRRAFAIDSPNGLEILEPVTIGGIEQWISIRGEDQGNPLLLFLHGGPGGSALPRLRHYNSELEEHFTVVNWDQRGAGKSYSVHIPEETFTIEQFVSDTLELTLYLRDRFAADKIYLMGHSWGTLPGILAVHQHPELYHAYIGVSQVVNPAAGEAISYSYCLDNAQREGNETAVSELKVAGAAPYPMDELFWENLGIQRKWLSYYGGVVYDSRDLFPVAFSFLSPEYTIRDFFNLQRANRSSVYYLWDEMLTVNLMQQLKEIEVPVYFLTGRYDYVTPYVLTEAYHAILKAPHKELIWFEHSAHSPLFEEAALFNQILIKHILNQ